MANIIQKIDKLLGLPAIIAVTLGIIVLIFAIVRIRRGKLVTGGIQGLLALILISVGTGLILFGINLYTYQRLTLEQMPKLTMQLKLILIIFSSLFPY